MKMRLLLAILMVLSGYIAKTSEAAIILSVDLDSATPGIQNLLEAPINGSVTANLVLELTGTSTLAGYQFSINYDPSELNFVSRTETAPAGFGFAETDLTNGVNTTTGRLIRFGADTGVGPVAPAGPFIVATSVFTAFAPGGSLADIDITPGKFEAGLDDFLENGTFAPIPDNQIVFNGASIVAVPEPSSLALLGGAVAALTGVRRRRS